MRLLVLLLVFLAALSSLPISPLAQAAPPSGPENSLPVQILLPTAVTAQLKAKRLGWLLVSYRGGKISSVQVLQSCGNDTLDKVVCQYARAVIHAPHGSGSGKVLYDLADFTSTPPMHLPPKDMRADYLDVVRNPAFAIDYLNGKIKKVSVVTPSGSNNLDHYAMWHIRWHFKVRPGASGHAVQPLDLLNSPDMKKMEALKEQAIIANSGGKAKSAHPIRDWYAFFLLP